MSGAIYVGKLYAYQLKGGEPSPCVGLILGVDPEIGLVQATTRRELRAGNYIEPPTGARGESCERLWYERRRKIYPDDRFWFHDLGDCQAFISSPLDNGSEDADRTIEATPLVILRGPDVETCPEPPGDFLCG